jgi:hypothetical protein
MDPTPQNSSLLYTRAYTRPSYSTSYQSPPPPPPQDFLILEAFRSTPRPTPCKPEVLSQERDLVSHKASIRKPHMHAVQRKPALTKGLPSGIFGSTRARKRRTTGCDSIECTPRRIQERLVQSKTFQSRSISPPSSCVLWYNT